MRFAEDEDVVQVNDDEAVEDGLEDRVHEVLERGWSVAETEGHDEELVVAISRPERRFWDVFVLDANLPVAGTQVEFGEVFAPSKSVEEVFDARARIPVINR